MIGVRGCRRVSWRVVDKYIHISFLTLQFPLTYGQLIFHDNEVDRCLTHFQQLLVLTRLSCGLRWWIDGQLR